MWMPGKIVLKIGGGYVEGIWRVGGGYMEGSLLIRRSMPEVWIFAIGNQFLQLLVRFVRDPELLDDLIVRITDGADRHRHLYGTDRRKVFQVNSNVLALYR